MNLNCFIPRTVKNKRALKRYKEEYELWQQQGCPVPPPHLVKQLALTACQKKTGYRILVETGTYLGDMVEAQKTKFNRIYSVELSVSLWRKAVKRFRKDAHVIIVQGDSGKVLKEICEKLDEPAVFWLDGHYSGGITAKGDTECPVFGEIDAIFDGNELKHAILIDDARCFTGEGDYPAVDELTMYIQKKNPDYRLMLEDDIMKFMYMP